MSFPIIRRRQVGSRYPPGPMVDCEPPRHESCSTMSSSQSCQDLLANLNPTLSPDPWIFAAIAEAAPGLSEDHSIFALIREDEGLTAIRPATPDDARGNRPLFARITLQVHSDLEAVGLTAAVSGALAAQNLCANIVAGLNHDHLFVPYQRGEEALLCLRKISAAASAEQT